MNTFVTTMGKASIFQSDKKIKIEIKKKYVTYNDLIELESLKEKSPQFLDLVEIKDNGKKVSLIYSNPANYTCLHQIKKKNDIIKLSILEKILANNPCEKITDKVVLSPKNIYVGNMKQFAIAYRSNGLIPYKEDMTYEEQYKLLIYSMLSNYNYEHVQQKKQRVLEKEQNTFFNMIEQCETTEEIHYLVKKKLYEEETSFFEKVEVEKQKTKMMSRRKNKAFVAAIIVVFLFTTIRTKIATNTIEQQVTAEIEKKEDVSKVYLSYVKGENEEANKNIHNTDLSNDEIMDVYMYTGQYELLIEEFDAAGAKKAIEYLYKLNEPEKILELDNENTCQYVEQEKAILNHNTQSINAVRGMLEDDDQKLRLAYMYLEDYDESGIEFVTSMYGFDLKEEISEAKKGKFKNPYSLTNSKSKEKNSKEPAKENTIEESIDE